MRCGTGEVEELFCKEAGLEVCENRWDYGNGVNEC